jgi:drug/metabolite transporter (DMT)-like permease
MVSPPALTQPARRKALIADLLLFSVAIFWGSNFVIIKSAVRRSTVAVSPAARSIVAGTMLYLLLRYIVASGIFAAVQPRSWREAGRRDWAMGGLLGAFYLTALVLQTVGLQRTSPGVSGFITGLSVAMVPFLYWAVAKRSPGRWQIVGAVIATIGLAALSLRGNFTLKWGDSITLLATFFYALHIMTTGFFAPKVQPTTLAVTQMAVSTVALAVIAPFFVHLTLGVPWQVWAAIVWTALSGTIYAFFIQSWAQRYTTSTHAAILLGFESVFAATSGIVAGMDHVTWRLLVGGSLMLVGVFVVELLPLSRGGRAESQAAAAAPLGGASLSATPPPATPPATPPDASLPATPPDASLPATPPTAID